MTHGRIQGGVFTAPNTKPLREEVEALRAELALSEKRNALAYCVYCVTTFGPFATEQERRSAMVDHVIACEKNLFRIEADAEKARADRLEEAPREIKAHHEEQAEAWSGEDVEPYQSEYHAERAAIAAAALSGGGGR